MFEIPDGLKFTLKTQIPRAIVKLKTEQCREIYGQGNFSFQSHEPPIALNVSANDRDTRTFSSILESFELLYDVVSRKVAYDT